MYLDLEGKTLPELREEAKKLGGDIAQCMEELVIPDTVKRVQALSFYKFKKLSKVTLPEDIILGYKNKSS